MEYLDTTGRIFDVQRYSIHDGPGIRTIVFLKGCVLRCQWCCNPESQEYKIQTMKTPDGVKTMGRDVTVREMIELVEKDRPYYYRSGGGMTLSGGECLCQPEFARDLLRAAKERGINTAIESMACVPWKNIEMVLPYLDTYLMDIKHTDQEKHKQFTGKPNGLALENARKVALSGQTNLVIRVPVIPTITLVALITAYASEPTSSPSSSTAAQEIVAVIIFPPPISIVTIEFTAPLLILITFPFNWLRALNFMFESSFLYFYENNFWYCLQGKTRFMSRTCSIFLS